MPRPWKEIKRAARRGLMRYPLATIAFYGPDDRRATKMAVAVLNGPDEDPAFLERWHASETDIREDEAIAEGLVGYLQEKGVNSVTMVERLIGCPHEEGIDYPEGEPCPHCPYWTNRDRWTGKPLS